MDVDTALLIAQKCAMTQHNNPAAWVDAMKRKHKLTEDEWARRAGTARTTIVRAKQKDYQYTTKGTTLAKLAAAIGEPVPAFGIVASGLNAEGLAGVVAEIVQVLAPGTRIMDEALQLVAEALQDILEALAADPDAAADPAKTRAVAKALIRRHAHRSALSASN